MAPIIARRAYLNKADKNEIFERVNRSRKPDYTFLPNILNLIDIFTNIII